MKTRSSADFLSPKPYGQELQLLETNLTLYFTKATKFRKKLAKLDKDGFLQGINGARQHHNIL